MPRCRWVVAHCVDTNSCTSRHKWIWNVCQCVKCFGGLPGWRESEWWTPHHFAPFSWFSRSGKLKQQVTKRNNWMYHSLTRQHQRTRTSYLLNFTSLRTTVKLSPTVCELSKCWLLETQSFMYLHALIQFSIFQHWCFLKLVCVLDLYLSVIASVILLEKTFLHWQRWSTR